jgi:hypothetical protein
VAGQTLRAEQSDASTKPSEVKKTVVEGNSGTTLAWFPASLSQPAKGGRTNQIPYGGPASLVGVAKGQALG